MELKKAAETKKYIAETAFQLFLRKGYHGTAMSELVSETDLSKGAFYYHFKSKETLYAFVVESFLAPLFLPSHLEGLESKELKGTLAFLFSSYQKELKALSSLIKDNIARYYSFFFEAFQLVPEFKVTVQNFYNTLQGILAGKLQAAHGLDKTKADKTAIKYIAQYEGIIFWTAIFPDVNGNSLLKEIELS